MITAALKAALLGATDPLGAMIRDGCPKPAGCDDWEYRDIPFVDGPLWNQLIQEAGGGAHIRAIAFTDRDRRRRGQLWVSPEGCARLKAYAERRPS
jgi:hypothetical protein